MSERATGYEIRLIDADKLTDLIRERVVRIHGANPDEAGRYSGGRSALVKTEKGIAYLCTEGVGWWAEDDGTIEVEFHAGMHTGYTAIPLEDVVACMSSEKVELGEFIRTFGSRLESNFWAWKNAIDGIEQDWEV